MNISSSFRLALTGFLLFRLFTGLAEAQNRTTGGYVDVPRAEAPGTLLSHPIHNGSEEMGRTVTLNYLNGWLIVGQEGVGSREGSDHEMRVFDVADPRNPVRVRPSDFGHTNYLNNNSGWMNTQTDSGFASHGTAKFGNYMLPDVMRVQTFGGTVERGAYYLSNGVPTRINFPIGDHGSRSSLAGPWYSTYSSGYAPAGGNFEIGKFILAGGGPGVGTRQFVRHATFDHSGAFGMGGWAPMFFGDLLIYAREVNDSGFAAKDGVVVYRIPYGRLDNSDPAQRTLDPQLVGTLPGGFSGYWPVLFSDGTGLYVIGADTDVLMGVDISRAADPAGDGTVSMTATLTVPGFSNSLYPVFQDHSGFIHNRKIDITRFLAGNPNPISLTLNMTNPPMHDGSVAPSGVDTSQMSLVMGNLWVTGGYPHRHGSDNYLAQGMAIWVHQQEPDTVRPRVAYHIPQANRANYPRHAPLSFMLHEHSRAGGPVNGVDFLVRPVSAGGELGAAVAGFLIHDFSGVLTFTPDAPLEAATTYQVDFVADEQSGAGFRDVAGNWIEPYSFRFSTGPAVDANPLPVLEIPVADSHTIAPGGNVTVTASASGAGPFEYRFHFGEEWSEWGPAATATHTFNEVGRPRVLVQARDANGAIAMQPLTLLVANAPQGPQPTASGTMAVGNDAEGRRVVWSVNPDADTVAVVDALTGNKVAEHETGKNPRTVTRDGNGRYWLACHGSDDIWVLNGNGTLHHRIALRYGAAPYGVVASPDGSAVFASLYGSGRIMKFNAADPAAAPLERATFDTPRALAISGNGTRVFVTRFISAETHGEVGEFRGSDLAPVRTLNLMNAITHDASDRAAGVPNYLAGIAISPDGRRAAVVSKQDNTRRGVAFGVGDLTHETMVRAVVSFLDIETANAEIRHTRRDFDNSESPSAVAWSPMGDRVFVALQGNNRIAAVDHFQIAPSSTDTATNSVYSSPAVVGISLETGLAPQGVLVDAESNRIFSQDFMGRSVTVFDAEPLLERNRPALPMVARTDTVDEELLPGSVLLGKQIFYNAADPRMGADSYISCASCHVDGGHDGRAWDFTGRGEGLRRTTDLRGRSGTGQGNVHWSGNFDEVQDFEHDIRGPFGGTGFLPMTPEQFENFHPSPASGKAGLSVELDALAAYVESLGPETVPKSPHRAENGNFTVAAHAGRARFESMGCTDCHSGEKLTESAVARVGEAVLRGGTVVSGVSGSRLGAALAGIDTPGLHGLHATRLYLHHGLATGLAEVFSQAGGRFLNAFSGNYAGSANGTDSVIEGGGGYVRGAFGGTFVQGGVVFQNVDGGAGGAARIGVRYSIGYGNSTATLRVNGVDHAFPLRRHFPDYGWMAAGWNWDSVDVTLQPGTTNTVEVVPATTSNFALNGIRVSNADDLAGFERHGRVAVLPQAERDELFAYLRQVDGRDAAGVSLNWGPVHAPAQPQVLENPAGAVIAQGNTHRMQAVVAGRGPFSFQWLRNGAEIPGATLQELVVANAAPAQAGNYSVRVSSDSGTVVSFAAELVVQAPLALMSSSLVEGRVNRSYEQVLAATGGLGNRTWSLVAGILPPGMEFLANGTLRGTPTAPAREELTFRVADSSGTVERSLLLEIAPRGGFSTDPDLILHYTFDEGAGSRIWDIARAGNDHSTTVPGVFWSATGRMERSFGSGGTNNQVRDFFPANQSDLNFDPRVDQFTIATWARSSGSDHWRVIFTKDMEGAAEAFDQFKMVMPREGNRLNLNSAGQSRTINFPAGINLVGEEWHHLAFVNVSTGSGMRTRIYRNGQLLGEFQPGTTPPGTQLMRIGSSTHSVAWSGGLDDFRVYKRALTVAELNALQQSPSSVDLGGLTLTYDGTPRSVVVETDPPGLAVAVTYNGSATPPTDAGNYTVQANVTETGYAGSASGILSVARKPLTVSGLSGVDKFHDGTFSASVTGTPVLDGVVPGDSVSLTGTPTFVFENSFVGAGKSLIASGYEISGTSAGNYFLHQPTYLTASILPAPYDAWAGFWNLTGSAAESASDPDGDGYDNLAEFAFAGNPLAADATLVSITSGDGNMTVTFLARTSNETVWNGGNATGHGVNYQIQSTTDLTLGFGTAEDILNLRASDDQAGIPSADFPYVRWKFEVPLTGDKRFHRVKATPTGEN